VGPYDVFVVLVERVNGAGCERMARGVLGAFHLALATDAVNSLHVILVPEAILGPRLHDGVVERIAHAVITADQAPAGVVWARKLPGLYPQAR